MVSDSQPLEKVDDKHLVVPYVARVHRAGGSNCHALSDETRLSTENRKNGKNTESGKKKKKKIEDK